jgi:hypothetical protein
MWVTCRAAGPYSHASRYPAQVEGLAKLTQLMFLDLSHNRIARLDERALPPSLHFVKVGAWGLMGRGGARGRRSKNRGRRVGRLWGLSSARVGGG